MLYRFDLKLMINNIFCRQCIAAFSLFERFRNLLIGILITILCTSHSACRPSGGVRSAVCFGLPSDFLGQERNGQNESVSQVYIPRVRNKQLVINFKEERWETA